VENAKIKVATPKMATAAKSCGLARRAGE
jgi:hypothetical protein